MKAKTVLTLLALTMFGCNEPADERDAREAYRESGATGTLALRLVSADRAGRVYRLRNAVFNVQRYWSEYAWQSQDAGPFAITLSSESDIDAPLLSVKLTPGNYDVALGNSDWYLERNTNGVWQRVPQAVLLSAPNQSSYVVDQGVSNLDFRFGVDGELLDFRAGDLQIGISIEQPGEGAPDAGWTGGTGGFGGTTGGYGGTTGGYGGTTGGYSGGTTGGGYDAGF